MEHFGLIGSVWDTAGPLSVPGTMLMITGLILVVWS